ncbi:hypothetical protein, partial [Escherichia coli]|uniref:hypothetical protein n=1 Tax=Escherichia coli TaxID=562 RepID=UPI001AA0E885
KRAYCLKTQPATGETYPKSDLFNKALRTRSNIPYHQNSSSLPKKNVQKIIHGKLSGALTILMDC